MNIHAFRMERCARCTCPRWEHWRERLCDDRELLVLSDACDEFTLDVWLGESAVRAAVAAPRKDAS